jgi:hypothetical protein
MDEAPLITYGSWFPASVLLPDGRIGHKARIYVTSEGLKVFLTKPADGLTPDWESPIVFSETAKPDWTARNFGVDFVTEAGTVVVTPSGNCGCGSSLKRWGWPQAVTTGLWPSEVPE